MLDFKVDGIPSKLGLYVVDKFNPDSMEIRLETGVIQITLDMIQDVLGVRNMGVCLTDIEVERDENIVVNWLSQFYGDEKITPAHLKLKIEESENIDLNSKLNFLVLFTSIMGNIKRQGVCDLGILDYIKSDTDLDNINWCAYVWGCLKTCKSDWAKGKKDCFFRGPLTFLTLCYVHFTKLEGERVSRQKPVIGNWTSEKLSKRENEEMLIGGFGKLEIYAPNEEEEKEPIPTDIDGCVWMLDECIKNVGTGFKEFERVMLEAKRIFPDNVQLGERVERISCFRDYQFSWVEKSGRQDAVNETMHGVSTNVSEKLNSTDLGVENSGVNDSGKDHCDKIVDENVFMENVELGGFDETSMYGGPLTQEAVIIADNYEKSARKGKEISTDEAPSFSLGMTQEPEVADTENVIPKFCGRLTQQAIVFADAYEKSVDKGKKIADDEIPSFSLGMTQELSVVETDMFVTPVPLKTQKPLKAGSCKNINVGRGKREVAKSSVARSPFVQRVVDIGAKLTIDEQKCWKYVTEENASPGELMFSSFCGQRLVRMDLCGLVALYADTAILSSWSVVLNHLEMFRSNESPARMFLPTFDVKMTSFMEQNIDDQLREMSNFINNFICYTNQRIEKSELVFLPVDNCRKEFVLCFDMRTGSVRFFEFKKTKSVTGKGKGSKGGKSFNIIVAEMIKCVFGRYVENLRHTKVKHIIGAYLVAGSSKWQGDRFRKVSGMCLMRVMETYSGEDLQRWDNRLEGDKGKLEKQLGILAKKYVAKIVLSESNSIMATVRGKLATFKI